MKKTATVFVSAMLILSSCAAVTPAEPEQSETTSQTTTVATSTAAVEMPASQQNEEDYEIYETDGVSYHIPNSWKFVNTDNESKEYKKFKADDFSFSVQFHEDYSLDISMPDSDIITALERKYTKASVIQLKHFNVGENDCIYFVCRDEGKAEGSEVVKLACQSKNGVVYFNFFDNPDMEIKNKALDSFAENIAGNQSFTDFFNAKSLKNLSNWDNANLKDYKIDDFSFKLPSSYKCSEEDNDIICNAVDGMIQIMKTGSEPIDMIPIVTDTFLESFTESGAIITDQTITDDNIFLYQYKHENGRKKIYSKGAFFNTNKQIVICQVNSYKSADEASAAFDKFYSTFAFDTSSNKEETTAKTTTTTKATTTAPKTTTAETTTTTFVDVGNINAVKSAQSYLSFMAFSYSGLVKQLEYEGYSHADAQYAVDNCGANWTEQAAKKAKEYLDTQAFSRSGLIKQLQYEGFSQSDATYGADSSGADWNQQATKKAQDYIGMMSFSRDGLIKQLEYEGFTAEQAAYGTSAVGL